MTRDSRTVIANWLDQTGRKPVRTSNHSLYYKDRTLYSYRDSYPIATATPPRHTPCQGFSQWGGESDHVYDRDGNRVEQFVLVHPAMLNWTGVKPFSKTTARHMSLTLQALSARGIYPLPSLIHKSPADPERSNPGLVRDSLGSHVVVDPRIGWEYNERVLAAAATTDNIEKAKRARRQVFVDMYVDNALHALHHLRLCSWWSGQAPAPETPLSLTERSPCAVQEALREELWITKVRREMVA